MLWVLWVLWAAGAVTACASSGDDVFEGADVRDRWREGLRAGEYEVDCPSCDVGMFIVIGAEGCLSARDDHSLREAEKGPLRPSMPQESEGLAKRLHDRALADGQPVVTRGLPHLFGRAVCPDRGTAFSVADRIAAHWMP
ncbi:hypothetical protein ACWDZ4_19700 [Streptomyces sp. NPDC003016]